MTSRDWDKEMAKIDKQLASLPDEAPAAPAAPAMARTGMPRGVAATAPRAPAARPPSAVGDGAVSGKAKLWTYTKLAVSVAGGIGVWFWPWPARCGLPLMGLVAAGATVGLLGLWSAAGTWRHRLGKAHMLSLLVLLSGGVLVAREVLPRVGYAQATFDRPGRWTCQAVPAGELPAVTPPNAAPGTTAPSRTRS